MGKGVTRKPRYRLPGLLGLLLLMFSGAAMALGLGEIRVRSQPGQPLLAEIPIISTEPGELEQLSARLASPATFERVGLPRPQGLVSDLNFAVALDEFGRPVVRVTSRAPVDVAAVNFLIEVDWGQGRLVREYSALVNAPGSVAAVDQPLIETPQAAPTDTIVRPVEAPLATAPTPDPPPPEPSAPSPVAPVPPPAAPAPTPVAQAPSPTPGSGDIEVRRGQSLSRIARDLTPAGYTLDQTMLALLRANPEAFINGNINLLKQGAVLRVPQSDELAQLGQREAAALVRTQVAEWRQARRPIPQPAAVAQDDAAPAAASAPHVADARLEIAPPASSAATQAGTQSGITAGGEGDMLANEQLQQTREDLAARESEVQELRTQVAELEKLKQQQEQLIAMKDSDLAAAQQRLAESQGGAGGLPVWAWAGLGLLVLGALVWALASRRQRLAPPPAVPRKPMFDTAAMAAAVPTPAAATAPPAEDTPVLREEATVEESYEVSEDLAAPPAQPAFALGPTPAPIRPTWHSGDAAASVAPLNSAPAGRERLELALAYLDLGDADTARDLLNEVAAGEDKAARDQAMQLLREIG